MQLSFSQNILALRTQLNSLYEQIESHQTAEPQTIFNADRLEGLHHLANRLGQTIHLAQQDERNQLTPSLLSLKEKLTILSEQASQAGLGKGNMHDLLAGVKDLKEAINEIYVQTFKPDGKQGELVNHQEEFEEDAVTQVTYHNIRRAALYFQFHFPKTTQLLLEVVEVLSKGGYGEELKEKTIAKMPEIWSPYPLLKLAVIHLCRANQSLNALDCLPFSDRYESQLQAFRKAFPDLTPKCVTDIVLHDQKLKDLREGLKALNEIVAAASIQLDQKMFLGLSSILQGKINPPSHILDQILLLLYEGRAEEANQIAQSSSEPIKSQARQLIYKQRILANSDEAIESLMTIESDSVQRRGLLQIAILVVDISPEFAIKALKKIGDRKEQVEAFLDLAKYIQDNYGDAELILNILEKAPLDIHDELYQEFATYIVDQNSDLAIDILQNKVSPEQRGKAFKELAAFILSGEARVNSNEAGNILHQMTSAVIFQDLPLAIAMVKQINSDFFIGAALLRLAKSVAHKDLELSVKILKNIDDIRRQTIAMLELAKFATYIDLHSAIEIVKETAPRMSLTWGLKELAKFLLDKDAEACLKVLQAIPNPSIRDQAYEEFSQLVNGSDPEQVTAFSKLAESFKAANPELANAIFKNLT